ncbi:DUF1549 and DUF1553 domain-containing protein [Frigoriglobus tundricola]|uniref:BIG2 domain-containing protein n=1 Tax=Frigoriglobus tundricola TaxID=2774151 RepID=A0A6M5YRV7_9BACT|nr:DUF1549 and DUF1553 domain-containing protein [Frigoriglobus tundricola]QJW96023.1 hypothetical protein FTUN_3577 [Frigoriglobus tundricola]
MFSRFFYALVACAALSGASRGDSGGRPPVGPPAGVDLPTGGRVKTVDFERHIMGLLSKAGCNAGSCHGSFQGKNGFRLSLFGYEPAADFANLTRDNLGRRVNVVEPDESLLLLKATGQTPHDGGMRFGKDGWVYNTFREWIRSGAKWDRGSGAIEKLEISPADFALLSDAKAQQLTVTATFRDGTREDITPFCDFKITDDAIASVSPFGLLTPRQPGDAGLAVLYRGSVKAIRVLVPSPARPGPYPAPPEVNDIDQEVFAKLKLMNVVPSDLAPDEMFLRRVYIDTLAQLPPPDVVRQFVADTDPKKREKMIDALLAHPLHAAVWATKLSDITGNNTAALEQPQATQPKRSQMWHDWLRKRVADNVPYDQIVRDILTATSRDGAPPEEWVAFVKKVDEQSAKGFTTTYPEKKTLDLFWRRQAAVPTEQWGEKVAAAFLGVRLECAQCHKHPTDRWTQEEYWAFANVFSQVTFQNNQFSSPDVKKVADTENAARREGAPKGNNNQILLVRELFVGPAARLRPNPATNTAPKPRALGGPEIVIRPGTDARVALAEWVTAKDNPFFARSFANRVWAHYFGVGLVNPVDDFSLANPPTNARLLDVLARDFIASNYDIRKLERAILMSRTYQLSYVPNATNTFDKNNYSHAFVRPLMAEQVVDVLNAALGVEEKFTGQEEAPLGTKMVELGSSRLNGSVAYALRIFGRPPRTTACDCERATEPALPQTLFRMTDTAVLTKFTAADGRTLKLAKSKLSDEELAEEAFLATLSRVPKPSEKADAVKHLKESKNRTEGVTDLLWALVNTREFILNH